MAHKRLCFIVFFLVKVFTVEANTYLSNAIIGTKQISSAPQSSPVTTIIEQFPLKIKCQVSVSEPTCRNEQENSFIANDQFNATSKILNSLQCDLSKIDIIGGFNQIENRVSAEFCSKIKICALREPNYNQGLECVVKNNYIESIMSSDQFDKIAKASMVTNLFKDDTVVSISKIQEELSRNFQISDNLSCEAIKKESESKCQKEEIKSLLSVIQDNEYINNFFKSDLLNKQKIDENNFLSVVHDYNKSRMINPHYDSRGVDLSITKTLNFLSNSDLKENAIKEYFNGLKDSKSYILRQLSKNPNFAKNFIAHFQKLKKKNELEVKNYFLKEVSEKILPKMCETTKAYSVGYACEELKRVSIAQTEKDKELINEKNGYLISENSLLNLNLQVGIGTLKNVKASLFVRSCKEYFTRPVFKNYSPSKEPRYSLGNSPYFNDSTSGSRVSRDKNFLNKLATAVGTSGSNGVDGYASDDSDYMGQIDNALGVVQNSLGTSHLVGSSSISEAANDKIFKNIKPNSELLKKESESGKDSESSEYKDEFKELRSEMNSLKKELRKKEEVKEQIQSQPQTPAQASAQPTAQTNAQNASLQKETDTLKKKIADLEAQLSKREKMAPKKISQNDFDNSTGSWFSKSAGNVSGSEKRQNEVKPMVNNADDFSANKSVVSSSKIGSSNTNSSVSSIASSSNGQNSSNKSLGLALSVRVDNQSMKVLPKTTTQEEITAKMNEMPFLVENEDGSYTQFLVEESEGKKSIVTKKIAASKVEKPKNDKREIASEKTPLSKEFKEGPVSKEMIRLKELQDVFGVKDQN